MMLTQEEQEFLAPLGLDDDEEEVVDVRELGYRNCQWYAEAFQSFLTNLPSQKEYTKWIKLFLDYHLDNPGATLVQNVRPFFDQLHDSINDNGQASYAPTSLRTYFSMLCSFFRFAHGCELSTAARVVDVNITNWCKLYEPSKAAVFEENEVEAIYRLESTASVLQQQVVAVFSVANAGRECEIHPIEWKSVKRVKQGTASEWTFKYYRAKKSGVMEEKTARITGELANNIVDTYVECFPMTIRRGRFFRKLQLKDSSIVGTNRNVGINTLSNYGKNLASLIGLAHPEKYTGHCWRRTSIRIMAEHGCTLPQMKAITGHRSDMVLQDYISNSRNMQYAGNDALTIGSSATTVVTKRKRESVVVTSPKQASVHYHFHNCTIGTFNAAPADKQLLNSTFEDESLSQTK